MAKKVSRIDVVQDDVFKGIGDSAEKTEVKVIVLKNALEAIVQAQKQIKKEATSAKGSILNIDPSTVKAQKELNKLAQESNTIHTRNAQAIQSKIRVTKALTIEEAKLKEEVRKANVESRQVARLKLAEEGSVDKLRAKLSILTREWDKLSDAERKNTKRGERLKKGIDETTVSVTKLEQSTNRHQRNVGNYGSALDGLKGKFRSLIGLAGQFGLALGGGFLVKQSIDVLTEFDEKLADIAKTTGLTTEQAKELSIELFDIDTKTSITNLQELASAAGRLGITGKANILAFAEASDKVFVALGDDLEGTAEEIATNLGKIASVFGLEGEFGIGGAIERVGSSINELSANSKASGGAIQDFTNRMAGLASVLELQDVQALGALFDESGQSIEVASSTLNKLLPELSANFKKFAGVAGMTPEAFKKIAEESPIEALKAVAKGAKSNEKGLFALTETLESYGVESARATGIVGVLTDNVDRLTELQKISGDAMKENTSITDEFNIKNATLSATWEQLTKKFQQWIIESDTANGITEKLKATLGFLADNVDTIVKALGLAVKVFLVYKARLIAINLAQKVFASGADGMNVSLKQMTKNFKEGAKAGTGFGGAIKSIGWTALIALAYEYVAALYDVASGAMAARHQAELYEKAVAKGTEQVEGIRAKLNATYQNEINAINDLRSLNQITDKEQQEQTKSAMKNQQALISGKLTEVRAIYAKIEAQKQSLKTDIAQAEANMTLGGFFSQSDVINLNIQKEQLRILKADGKQARTIIEGLREDYHAFDQTIIETTQSINTETTATKESTKAIKEKTKELLGLTYAQKEFLRSLDVDQEIKINALEFNIEDAQANTDAIIEEELKRASEGKAINIDLVNSKIEEEERLKRELIQIQYEYDLLNAKSQSDVELATQTRNQNLIRLDAEYAKRKNETLEELNNAQEEYSQKETETVKETAKANYEEQKKWIELTEKLFTDNIDKKIALIEKELQAHKDSSDALKKLAEDGNITAQQSIAEEERLANEAQIKMDKLEARKRQIQLIAAFMQSYLNALEEGKDSGQALLSAGKDKGVLEAFISTIPAFLDGTDDTGKTSNPLDANGGRLALLHDNERVLTKEHNAELKGMSNDEVVRRIQESKIKEASGNIAPTGWANLEVVNQLNGLKDELKNVQKAIESKPEIEYNLQEVVEGLYSFTRKQTKGNTIVYNKYRVNG